MGHRPRQVLLAFLLSVAALPLKSAPPENAQCLGCHGPAAPSQAAARVDANALKDSAHSGLACTDCHEALPAEGEAGIPHARRLPEVSCATRCHQEPAPDQPGLSPRTYADSVHGRGRARGENEAARCWDCHGKHNITAASDPRSLVNKANIPLTCSRCHEDMSVVLKYNIHQEAPYHEYSKSVHGRSLTAMGAASFAAVCTDCHGVHNIQGVGQGDIAARKPETCGRCHDAVFRDYAASLHGREALRGNIDAPACVDCHGEHSISSPRDAQAPTFSTHIPDTCSTCHARPEIMKKYGVPENRISTFIDSMHGIAVGLGHKGAANCTSCHGVHDIRPASDPSSPVHPSNLRQTCGQPKCHPGMPAKIAGARIHVDRGSKKSGLLYYLQYVLLWAILVTAAVTLVWFAVGFWKKGRSLKSR